MCLKLLFSLSYVAIVLGSLGMIAFYTKFSFSTDMAGHEQSGKSFIGLNGKQIWVWSWWLIISGTVGQLIAFWVL